LSIQDLLATNSYMTGFFILNALFFRVWLWTYTTIAAKQLAN